MTCQVPLYYFSTHVGHALTDRDLQIDPIFKWRVEIPASIRSRRYTPDIIQALLREDKSTLGKCHPVLTINGYTPLNIRLHRLVFRTEIVPLINLLALHPKSNPRKERMLYEVSKSMRSIHRVIHLNRDRTDCRLENLRELIVELPEDDNPGLINPEEGLSPC